MSLSSRDRRDDLADPVGEEIRFYLEMRAKEFEDSGLDSESAWKEALRAFGDPEEIRRRVLREARMKRWTTTVGEAARSLIQEIRIAARSLRRDPVFTGVAVTTLALGIGASAAIFSLAREALLAGPPVGQPDRLVAVYTTSRRGAPRSSSSYPDYLDYRDRTEGLSELAATAVTAASLGDDERGASLITVQTITGDFFDVLRLGASAGRLLTPLDDRFAEGAAVAVLSHDLWRGRFGEDPQVVGRTIRLNGRPYEVVGVGPEGFHGLRIDLRVDAWVPMQSRPYLTGGAEEFSDRFEVRGNRWIDLLVGRLAPGVSVDGARAELLALSSRMGAEDPDARGPRSVTVDPLQGYILPVEREADFRTFVQLLGGTVALALLLCSANLANLLLARGSGRRREMGVRLALGAGRSRILRQLATESLVLAAAGGACGLALATGLLRVLGAFELPGGVSVASLGASLDTGMLVTTALVSLATALLFGVFPALDAGRTEPAAPLRGGRGARTDAGAARARRALVAVQVALCLVLLVGSTLFVRTLQAGLKTDLGFRPEGLALTRFNLDLVGYGPEEAWTFVQALEARLAGAPGVEAVTTTTRVPLQDGGAMGFFVDVDGYQPAPDEELRVDAVFATPGYPKALGLPLLEGRDFDAADDAGAEPVTLVSRSMAERYWPDGRALGGLVTLGGASFRVVGVVGNTTWSGLADEVTNFMYLPLAQSPATAASAFLTVAARSGDADAALVHIRTQLAALDRDVSIVYARTMEGMVGAVLMPQRMGALLLSSFGVLALVLSVVGIAGVVSYTVARERREIAVRIALGATRDSILAGLVRSMSVPVALGIAAGSLTAWRLSGLVEGLLYQVSGTDPVTYVVIGLGILAVATVATVVPARSATREGPAVALAAE